MNKEQVSKKLWFKYLMVRKKKKTRTNQSLLVKKICKLIFQKLIKRFCLLNLLVEELKAIKEIRMGQVILRTERSL